MSCAICGMRFPRPLTEEELGRRRRLGAMLQEMVEKSTARGRDSIGVTYLDEEGEIVQEIKVVGSFVDLPAEIHPGTKTVLVNCRAEPTTEWVSKKSKADIQPFHGQGVTVAHNGTIANDADFEKQGTRIDSSVFVGLFRECNTLDDAMVAIGQVTGSYAVAINVGPSLFLLTNYKPLVYRCDTELRAFLFASFPDFLPEKTDWPPLHFDAEVPPYSAMLLETGWWASGPLFCEIPRETPSNKALVICSGGLDSVVVASFAKASGKDVTLLHFDYGCRATGKERNAIVEVAKALSSEVIFYPLPSYQGHLQGVPLLEEKAFAKFEAGAEFAHEWVPARNLVFYSLAIALAEAEGFGSVYSGINLEESGAYPDNEEIFVRKIKGLVPFAVQNGKVVDLISPVAALMKHEIVKMGLEVKAPLHLTWSCYGSGEIHCGKCGPCFMRRTAFRMIGEEDVVPFEE